MALNGMRSESESLGLVAAGSVVFSAATALVGIANLLYHPLVSRELTVESYGALGALLALLAVLAVPVTTLQVVIARDVTARGKALGEAIDLGPLMRRAALTAVVATALTAAATPVINSLLDLTSSTTLPLAAYVLPIILQIVPVALLLSEGRFALAGSAVIAGALVRLATVSPLTEELGLSGAMWSNVAGAAVGFLLAAVMAFVVKGRRDSSAPPNVHYADAFVAILGLTGFWALHSVQVFLARIFLDPLNAGYFAAAAIVAQISVFVPALVATLVLPRFAAERGKGPAARALLIRALSIVALIGFVIATTFAVLHDQIIDLILGGQFAGASSLVGLIAFESAIAGLVYVVVYFFLSGRSRVAGLVPWSGVVLTVAAVAVFHGSSFQIAFVAAVVMLLTFALIAVLAISKGRAPITPIELQARELWNQEAVDLTMVVPFFNPGPGVAANITALADALDQSEVTYEIIAVSDGSTDDSAEQLEALQHQHVRVIRLERNAGKGQALRVGMTMGHGHYLGFIDADGDISPAILQNYVVLMRTYEPDIIFGSKRHPMSQVQYPILRRIYSFGYQQLIRVLFRLNVRDTQVGLKLVRRDVLTAALPRMLEKRFAFDLELFVVSRHVGYNKVFEAPIAINHGFTSTVSWRSVVGMMLDTAAIFYRLHLLHFYDEPQALDVDGEPVETRSTDPKLS